MSESKISRKAFAVVGSSGFCLLLFYALVVPATICYGTRQCADPITNYHNNVPASESGIRDHILKADEAHRVETLPSLQGAHEHDQEFGQPSGQVTGKARINRPAHSKTGPLRQGQPIRGWTILSDSEKDALAVIRAARAYNINHLQLSHEIIHDLREVKEQRRRELARRLTDAAHQEGIQEVVLWDHSLYDMEYYPARFRTGPNRTFDLDNPEFWQWLKQDYREMLDLVPNIDGLVLTFIETGARAEKQYSKKLHTNQEKLAAVVNAVADVVIGERKLNLYARTFAYTHEEYNNIVGAIKLFQRAEIRLMMKETPHDFFLTHPNDFFAGTIARPTIIEFDTGTEFNGQGLIANTWPQHILDRCRSLLRRPHVNGYVARTDRYGNTRIIGQPSEINLLALKRFAENRRITAEQVYDEFITARYGGKALPYLKAAFENAFDIVTSTLYTLGTNTANHSKLDYDPYASSYARHVSGKWFDPPVVFIRHGVNRKFHYWKDVINHLAPAWAKSPETEQLKNEVPWVLKNGWLQPKEQMNEEYLNYVVAEKSYGVQRAENSLRQIEKAKPYLSQQIYEDLHHYFKRTLLTARLHRAVAKAYFGFRVYARGETFCTPALKATVRGGLLEMKELAQAIKDYPVKPAAGQWNWVDDAEKVRVYYDQITRTGWPKETRGRQNSYGGITFPLD